MTGKEAARLFVTVGADTSSFTNGMRQVQSSLNQTSGAVNSTMGLFKQFALGQIVGTYALQGLNAALGFAKDSIIGFNANIEQATIGFTTMLGSGERATEMLNNLKQFAAATPFRFEGLLDSSKRLLAMGYAAEEIIPIMTTVGDAVAGLGAGDEGINRATYALGQMKTAGRILSQDMMQLTSLGVPAWQYLADAIGVSTAEVRKMTEQGLIPADAGIQAILAGMKQDFGGLMAKQATTFNGAMSNILDMLQQIVAGGFEPFFREVSKAALAVATFLQSAQGTEVMNNMKTIVQQVVDVMKTIIPTVFNVIGAIAGFVAANPWVMGLVGAFIALRIALVGLSIISGIIGLIQGMAGALGAVRAAFAVAGAATGFSTLLYAMSPALWGIVTAAGSAATAVWGFTAALLANPLTWIVLAVVGVTAAIVTLGSAFDETGEQAKRSAEMSTDAWKDTHSYLTSYNATAPRGAENAGYAYGAAYATGVTGTGPAQYAAGAYITGEAARGLTEQGVPAAAAAGQAVGTTFGAEMQSAAMIAFRAGERDITGAATATATDWQKALEEALKKLNMSSTKSVVQSKLAEAFALAPGKLRQLLTGGIGGLSGELQAIAEGAISSLYRAQLDKKFAAALTPKGKAIYEGFVNLKTEMVRGASEAVDRAKAKLEQAKSVLQGLKDAMAQYVKNLRDQLQRQMSLSFINLAPEVKETVQKVEEIVTSSMNGLARVVKTTTDKVTLTPILKDANYVVDQFRQRVEKMKQYIANLRKLQMQGLNKTAMQDIISMGVDEGGDIASALAGNNAAITQMNSMQAEIAALMGSFASEMGLVEYGGQIMKAETDVDKAKARLQRAQALLAEAEAFNPEQSTIDAIAAMKRGTATPTAARRNAGTTSTNNANVNVGAVNVNLPPFSPSGGTERDVANKVAQEVASALNNLTIIRNNGLVLR